MKLHLHKYIFKMMMGFFVISSSFVYAEGFKISLYPSKAEQVVSCVSFFAHKRSISDLTELEYRKLVALANYELNMKTLPPLPNGNGESQVEAKEELRKRILEMVQFGISQHVYEEILNFVKTMEEADNFLESYQIKREALIQQQKLEAMLAIKLEEKKQKAREVLLKYRYIIEDPNNVNLRNKHTKTYLHIASENNIIELVQALLLLNPSLLDTKDEEGWTALILASWNGHSEVVRTLLESGADPNLQDSDGRTALIWAALVGNTEAVNILKAHKRALRQQKIKRFLSIFRFTKYFDTEVKK